MVVVGLIDLTVPPLVGCCLWNLFVCLFQAYSSLLQAPGSRNLSYRFAKSFLQILRRQLGGVSNTVEKREEHPGVSVAS